MTLLIGVIRVKRPLKKTSSAESKRAADFFNFLNRRHDEELEKRLEYRRS